MMPRSPPAGFVTIGPGIYISLAHTGAAALDESSPNVVLIFGWMGALTRHLQRYSQKYTELYPHATQIIVKCQPSVFWASAGAWQNRLMAVVEALESLGCLPARGSTQESTRFRPRVLVHSFSNGGASQLTFLGRLLSSKYPSISPSEPLVSALILDSSPSTSTFRSIRMAFGIAIRNPIARYLALTIVYFLHALRLSVRLIFGVETMGMQYPKMLLRPRLLPWMNAQTPRLYVFSKKDALVPWQDVQRHAEAAKSSGLNVRYEVYEDSAHVAHMRLDPKRYWGSVQDLWQIACHESQVEAVEGAQPDAGDRCQNLGNTQGELAS